jgi:hypothetical protein
MGVINRAANGEPRPVTNMGINHGGDNIFVTQKLLDGADIILVFEQVCGKTMPESMTARRLGYTAGADGVFDGVLQVSSATWCRRFSPLRESTEIFSAGKTYCPRKSSPPLCGFFTRLDGRDVFENGASIVSSETSGRSHS